MKKTKKLPKSKEKLDNNRNIKTNELSARKEQNQKTGWWSE